MCGKIRFAPSPTGYLHEGHLLSALYVWAASHKWNLQVHLRIEDHDRGRARDEYIQSIYEDLAWFGFRWDSQSIQSERESVYRRALESLESRGLVYPCFCSRKQLEGDERREGDADASQPHNLRVVIPDKVIKWHDLRLGDFAENPKLQCGDFPIRDRDGQWTYQFAVCVDDIDEGITHVVRGEDLRNSTARQIALMELLGRSTPPFYLHHGLITDPTGKKLSKRKKAHSLRQDRDSGVSAEELLGRVCFKGGLVPSPAPLSLEQALSAALALL